MKFLLGSKIGMTQIFDDKGAAIAVTLIDVPPCVVTQIRTKECDGYDAVQLGFGKNKTNKPEKGHARDLGTFAVLKEYRVKETTDKKVGDAIDVSLFAEGDAIRVSGISKGKGFQGVVKRHHFGAAEHRTDKNTANANRDPSARHGRNECSKGRVWQEEWAAKGKQ